MEYFANDYRVVHQFARHYQTGQVGRIDFLYHPLGHGGGFCDLLGSAELLLLFQNLLQTRILLPFPESLSSAVATVMCGQQVAALYYMPSNVPSSPQSCPLRKVLCPVSRGGNKPQSLSHLKKAFALSSTLYASEYSLGLNVCVVW